MPGPITVAASALLAGAGVAAYIYTPFALAKWAQHDFLYTTIKEGRGKVVVKGRSFHRVLLSLEGYHVNEKGKPGYDPLEPNWEILPNEPGINYETRPKATREFGLYWVGIPRMRALHTYKFTWSELHGTAEGARIEHHDDEETQVFMACDFDYLIRLEDVKDINGVPLVVECVVIVRITNPYIALFRVDNWMTQLESYIHRHIRNFAGSYTYEELISETSNRKDRSTGDEDDEKTKLAKTKLRQQREEENFSRPVVNLTTCLPEYTNLPAPLQIGTKQDIGVTIEAANLRTIKLFGAAAAENEKTTLEVFVAERRAEAKRIGIDADTYGIREVADATAYATRETGQADADAMAAQLGVLDESPEMAKVMLVASALKSPGEGKTTVVIPSDLGGVIGKVFGKEAA